MQPLDAATPEGNGTFLQEFWVKREELEWADEVTANVGGAKQRAARMLTTESANVPTIMS